MQAVDDAIDSNADIAEAVLSVGLDTYGVDPESTEWQGTATPNDMDKARSTIRQLYRDFSSGGAKERQATFGPMLGALDRYTSGTPPSERDTVRVLIPGAGLGRLLLETCAAGYSTEGNEISYHQLLMSNWILNNQPVAGRHTLYPWALNFSNHTSRSNQLQRFEVPDVAPMGLLNAGSEAVNARVPPWERLSMTAGDFCVLYRETEYQQAFQAVLTCFFIDTAPNVISYIETVKSCLQEGGLWINMGPLLWHFEGGQTHTERAETDSSAQNDADKGIGEPGSFELTDEEVISMLQCHGFEVVEHDNRSHTTGYIEDPNSMLQSIYRPSFWVARRQ